MPKSDFIPQHIRHIKPSHVVPLRQLKQTFRAAAMICRCATGIFMIFAHKHKAAPSMHSGTRCRRLPGALNDPASCSLAPQYILHPWWRCHVPSVICSLTWLPVFQSCAVVCYSSSVTFFHLGVLTNSRTVPNVVIWKNLPVKGLRGRCFICLWLPPFLWPHTPPPLHCIRVHYSIHYTYPHRKGGGV